MNKEDRNFEAIKEFTALCAKYPDHHFIGNFVVNIYMLKDKYKKQKGYIFGAKESLFDSKKNNIIYQNYFKTI